MENEIIKYLSKYVTISKEVEKAIAESAMIKRYAKGTVLLRQGEIANEGFLVLKGCIRSYYLVDGKEKTTAFYTEEHAVVPLAYGKIQPLNTIWNALKIPLPVWELLLQRQRCLKSIRNWNTFAGYSPTYF